MTHAEAVTEAQRLLDANIWEAPDMERAVDCLRALLAADERMRKLERGLAMTLDAERSAAESAGPLTAFAAVSADLCRFIGKELSADDLRTADRAEQHWPVEVAELRALLAR